MSTEGNKTQIWDQMWSTGKIGFHQSNVHGMLEKNIDKLKTDGKLDKIFVPLCGKTVDMTWLSDQGIKVIGVDIIPKALAEFFSDNKLEYTKTSVPSMGPEAHVCQDADGKVKLYCGDILLFDETLEGQFDAIWDRASIVALNRSDVPGYVKLLKSLLKPGGNILLEVLTYDTAAAQAATKDNSKYPPPHPMTEEDVRGLYEPDCSVTALDEEERTIAGEPAKSCSFLITKK